MRHVACFTLLLALSAARLAWAQDDAVDRSCLERGAAACYELGLATQFAIGRPQDEAASFSYFTLACDAGHQRACAQLGWCYANGDGTQKDDERAYQLFSSSCDANEGVGCSGRDYLARELRGGASSSDDFATAKALLDPECDAGDSGSCIEIGWLQLLEEGHHSGDGLVGGGGRRKLHYKPVKRRTAAKYHR